MAIPPVLILTPLTVETQREDLPSPLLCPGSLGCLVLCSISTCLLVETRPYSGAQYIAQDASASLVQEPTGYQEQLTSHFAGCAKLTLGAAAPLTLDLGDLPGPSITDMEAHSEAGSHSELY